MKQEMITLSKEEYEKLRQQAEIDMDILHQFMRSLLDIKEGRVRRVR